MRILALVAFLALAVALAAALYWFFHVPTPEEKLATYLKANTGGKHFTTTVAGRQQHFYLRSCKVYILDLTPNPVKEELVLEPDLYLWFTGCADQEIRVEGEYLRVYLRVVAFGAGGGNQGGGDYRSKDGRTWEKFTDSKGWRPVSEVQR